MKKMLLFLAFILTLTACAPLPALAPAPSHTSLPTATRTTTPANTRTPIPSATISPSPTATLYPLSSSKVMQEVLIQEADLIAFFEAIDVPTQGFPDGSQMDFQRSLPEYTHWGVPMPDEVLHRYRTALQTVRVWPERDPLGIALHSNAIFVFPDEESAHAYYLADVEGVNPQFRLDMPTIGDESVAFSGYLEYNRPVGGVIWRYKEVYVFFIAQLNFPVTDEALAAIAGKIQARLAWVMERGDLDAPIL